MRDFFTSKEFADKPHWLQLLVCAMIVHADDDGVITADTAWLRNRFLIRTPPGKAPNATRIATELSRLEDQMVLERCQKDGVSCYRFPKFARYQKIKRRKVAPESEDEDEEKMNINPRKPPSKRMLDETEWSVVVQQWNCHTANLGIKGVAQNPKTARAKASRKKLFELQKEDPEIFDKILAELTASARGIVSFRGGDWFGLHWIMERPKKLEKFFDGDYRNLGRTDEDDRRERSSAETAAIAEMMFGEDHAVDPADEPEARPRADVVIEGPPAQVGDEGRDRLP